MAGANIRQIGVEVEVQCRRLAAPLEIVLNQRPIVIGVNHRRQNSSVSKKLSPT